MDSRFQATLGSQLAILREGLTVWMNFQGKQTQRLVIHLEKQWCNMATALGPILKHPLDPSKITLKGNEIDSDEEWILESVVV